MSIQVKKREFMSKRRVFWMFSITVITVGIIANILLGTEIDMRFTGGTVLRYSYSEVSEIPLSATDALSPVSTGDAAVSFSDVLSAADAEPEENRKSFNITDAAQTIYDRLGVRATVSINEQLETPGAEKTLVVRLTDKAYIGHNVDFLIRSGLEHEYPGIRLRLIESNSYDAMMGREFFAKCIVAVLLAVLLLSVYIAARFHNSGGFSVGGFGIIAVAYDVAIVYFAFVVLRYPIDNNFIAAVLAVIGYSLNSTIVIFDRIRENRRLFGSRLDAAQLADLSLNETITRTVSTNMCVLAALATLAVVSAIAHIESMLRFALPMMAGVISGCYSSLFLSTTLWVSWYEFKQRLLKRRQSRIENGEKTQKIKK